MKRHTLLVMTIATTLITGWRAKAATISGDYLEVRTCNVYAGTCFVNGEMGLTGKEGILVWSVRHGAWQGQNLAGLNAVAVVCAEDTLEDQKLRPRAGKAVLIVDERANAGQKAALIDFVRTQGGSLLSQIVETKSARVNVVRDDPADPASATVKVSGLVEISTMGLSGKTTPCGHAEVYYPPLTEVKEACVGFTDYAAYKGAGLKGQWEITSVFAAFVGKFAR
ncbi:MAG: DUF1326 domain-containing protein [Verrucomicrobia bacterium]|nr:DUF1326 domain-containing protein [Verrucomicrobiota bacterium]